MGYKPDGERNSVPVRDPRIDALKAFCIIAVVLFHMGYLTFGYLGVDVFLVVNGYLVTRSMLRSAENNGFSYFKFLYEKIVRLWPVVLVATAACMVLGYFTMLPDDYENLSESVVASNLFANNILACITTKNYWNVANDYKPLMHTWYLGVVVQSYFVLALVPAVVQLAGKNTRRRCGVAFLAMTVVSLVLFLLPFFSAASKFYYLPFRLFEITAGSTLACWNGGGVLKKNARIGQGVILCVLVALLVVSGLSISSNVRLLMVCVGTVALLGLWQVEMEVPCSKALGVLAFVGKYTLGIYIWHQILIAFFRYTVRARFTAFDVVLLLTITAVLTAITAMAERRIEKTLMSKRGRVAVAFGCAALWALVSGSGMKIYLRAGVVRDIPELDISVSDIHRGIHAEYNNRGYDYDVDFEGSDSGKVKVLAVGNSFARDWINILLESSIGDDLEISFYPLTEHPALEGLEERIHAAEYVFYAVSGGGMSRFLTI